ncbi:MAG: hypothetical protein HDR75_10505 [Bacteroides sp.]|nr:hypothetical protein [Bacteroides sp.]MBD5373750.1 hypothetical protein [Bacteroides sp.]
MNYYPKAIAPEDYMKISGVCRQYDAIIKNQRRDGGGDVRGYEGLYMVWTPTGSDERSNSWINRKSDDNLWIVEQNESASKNENYIEAVESASGIRRITYWRDNKRSPFAFIGVYQIDMALTRLTGMCVYHRISDTLPALEIIDK